MAMTKGKDVDTGTYQSEITGQSPGNGRRMSTGKFTFLKRVMPFFMWALTLSTQARTVDLVVIEEEGKSMDADPTLVEKCRAFKPTVEQVTHYFNYAYPIEADWAIEERYTPCYAAGIVTFNDDAYGAWILYSSGTASFNFRRGDHVTFFYRYNEWVDPTTNDY